MNNSIDDPHPILKIERKMIPLSIVEFTYAQFIIQRDAMLAMGNSMESLQDRNFKLIGAKGCFALYSPIFFETLSLYIKPKLEKILGRKIYPTYSYGRIYKNKSKLEKHTDRHSSEIVASVSIFKDIKWNFFIEYENEKVGVDLEPGDAVIYSGNTLPHWREEYTGKEHVNCFLSYVYVDGNHSHLKYDDRPYLATPPKKIL